MKTCHRCKKEKPDDSFYKRTASLDGLGCECKECEKLRNRKRDRKGYKHSHYTENKERYKAVMKKYNSENKDKRRGQDLKKKYGITHDDYEVLRENQKGCCAICFTHESGLNKRLHIDHCHTTGKVRGLLCSKCNLGIGLFNDDTTLMGRVIKYLDNFKLT